MKNTILISLLLMCSCSNLSVYEKASEYGFNHIYNTLLKSSLYFKKFNYNEKFFNNYIECQLIKN